MDDLKVYAKNAKHLGDTLRVVNRVLRAVGMELGLRKCATDHVSHRRYVGGKYYLLKEEQKIERIAQGGTYWYLGIKQVSKPHHETIRERLTEVCAKRLHHIWCFALSAKHMVHVTNTWAMPLFHYFFTQARWLLHLLVQLKQMTHRILHKYRSHYLAASVERLYLKSANGGRGMANLWHAYEQEVVGLVLYLLNMAVQDQLLQAVVSHQLYLIGHRNHRYSNLQGAVEIPGQYRVVPDLIEKLRTGEVIPRPVRV